MQVVLPPRIELRIRPYQGRVIPLNYRSVKIKQVLKNGAGDEVRTRDIYLGKVMLYQLSYSRIILVRRPGIEPGLIA